MQYNIIGDIHGRTCWKDIVCDDAVNVFLGDYFSPYDPAYDFEHCATNFQEIIDFAKERPETVLLIGNHDEDHWHWRHMKHASRFDWVNADKICTLFEENKDMFRLACPIGDRCLATHAGVSVLWYENTFRNEGYPIYRIMDLSSFENDEQDFEKILQLENTEPAEGQVYFYHNRWNIYKDGKLEELEFNVKDLAVTLNNLWQRSPEVFHWEKNAANWDYCGNSESQSPLWIRPEELIRANIFKGTDINQIVGHTQFKNPAIDGGIIFADILESCQDSIGIKA